MTYQKLKAAVRMGKSRDWILDVLTPRDQPKYIVKELYDRAVQELWEEQELFKTKIGQLIYG